MSYYSQRGNGGARALAVRVARGALANALCLSGGRLAVRTVARRTTPARRLLIVMYHLPTAQPPAADGPVLPSLCISASTLRKQLQQLARVREVVSMDEALRRITAPGSPQRREPEMAVITFDDGYAGVHEYALPILKELRLPAIAYVTTGHVGTEHRLLHDRLYAALVELGARRLGLSQAGLPQPYQGFLDRFAEDPPADALDNLIGTIPHEALVGLASALERRLGLEARELSPATKLMTWEQLAELKAAGVDIGGHSVNHVELANVSLARARAEIQGCRDDIAARLGAPPRHFAYPNSYYTRQVHQAVANAGFASAVTGPDSAKLDGFDLFALKRRVLWENSTAGALGYSSALAACYFDEVFAALRLQREFACERPDQLEGESDPGTAAAR